MTFMNIFSTYVKSVIGILIDAALNLYRMLWVVYTLKTFILSDQKQKFKVQFHLPSHPKE